MTMFRKLVLATAIVGGCTGPTGTDSTDDSDGVVDYPSDFTTGKHRATALTLEAEGSGADLDADGVEDNNLPFVLETADLAVKDLDMSLETFGAQIDTAIEDGTLNMLLDSVQAQGSLDVHVLSGVLMDDDQLHVDPQSLTEQGDPRTQLQGEFSASIEFSVSADNAELVVPFVAGEPPSVVPLERETFWGTMDGESVDAVIAGVIPSEQLASDVLAPLIPEEGVGSQSKESLLSTLKTLSALETISDIDLGDGRRGVSCAFRVKASAATWVE